MSWEPVGTVADVARPFDAVRAGGAWLFRTQAGVFAASPDGPGWAEALDPEADLGPKLLARAGDLAVTVEDFALHRPARVIAYHPATGERAWTAELQVKVNTFGLAAAEGVVLVHGDAPGGRSALTVLDAAGGAARHTVPLPPGNGAAVARGTAFAITSMEGVFAVDPASGEAREVAPVSARTVAGDATGVYVHAQNPSSGRKHAVVWIDAAAQAEGGRFEELEKVRMVSRVVPSGDPTRTLVLSKEWSGVADLRAGRAVCRLELAKGGEVLVAAWTSAGIVALREESLGRWTVAVHDPESGAVAERIAVKNARPSRLFHDDGMLVVTGTTIEFFRHA